MVYRPFNSVPPELLNHIHSLAWLSDTRHDSLSRFRFPSIVGQVDHYFHRTTLSTRILWSYLRVTKFTALDHIQDRIRRSGLIPLELCLIFANTHFEDANAMVEGVIVENPTLRFESITLLYQESSIACLDCDENFWEHLNLLSKPSLSLDVACFSMIDEADHVPLLHFLPSFAPSLRTLKLSGCAFSWLLDGLPESLETLSISEEGPIGLVIDYNDIIRHLGGSLCQSLRCLSLKGLTIRDSSRIPPPSFVLASLEDLEIRGLSSDLLVDLLHSIGAPKLRNLSIGNVYYQLRTYGKASRIIWKALRFPSLRKLTVQAFAGGDLQLVDLIANLPDSVKHLELIQGPPHLQDPTTACLQHQLTDPFFLGLDHMFTDGIPPHALASLIVGRCAALKMLQARFNVAPLPHEAQALEVLSGSVMELRIMCDGEGQDTDQRGLKPWGWPNP